MILMCQTDIPEVLILVINFQIQNAKMALGLVGMTHHLPEYVQKFVCTDFNCTGSEYLRQTYGAWEKRA